MEEIQKDHLSGEKDLNDLFFYFYDYIIVNTFLLIYLNNLYNIIN